MGRSISAPMSLLFVRDTPSDDGSPHVETSNGSYAYVLCERGIERSRRNVKKLDDLLFMIMQGVTSDMALSYELSHRENGEDFRRVYFEKWISLMAAVNPDWGDMQREAVASILRQSPYID